MKSENFQKFPSIEQYRHVIREVQSNTDYKGKDETGENIYNHTEDYPVIDFHATVKLHGSNACIFKNGTDIGFQSRNNIITLQNDNFGFVAEMSKYDLNNLFENDAHIYGEWIGKGIRQSVGIERLDRRFIIFGMKQGDDWVKFPKSYSNIREKYGIPIWSIEEFPTWDIQIDFNRPEIAQNEIVKMTIDFENECPVAKAFGIDNGIGEGIVLTAKHNDKSYMFKSKGEKHSVSNVKTLASVDVEKINNVKMFIATVVTTNRLKQGLENIDSGEIRNIKPFIDWVVGDVFKEEHDTIVVNGLDAVMITKEIGNVARKWFLEYIGSVK